MNWLILSVAALGIAAVAVRRYTPWLEQILRPKAEAGPQRPALRKVTALDRMIESLRHAKDPLERHRLLEAIVVESHRQRSDPAMKKVFLRFSGMHIKELLKIAQALKAAHGGKMPAIPTFELLAAELEENGRQEEALSVRKQAAALGLIDGMKEGANGRIQRRVNNSKSARPPIKRPGRKNASARGKGQP